MIKDMFFIQVPDFMYIKGCNLRCEYCFEHTEKGFFKMDKFEKYLENQLHLDFFPFGGEPLLKLDLLCDMIDKADDSKKDSLRKIITNGTLIPQNIEKLKEYKITCQISIDGPRHVHNRHRKYPDGRGSFDDVIKGISTCIKHKVQWSIHGVCTKDTLPHFSESIKWFWNTYKFKGIDSAIQHMKNNTVQIIFEQDYIDKDVDIIIEQFYDIFNWMSKETSINKASRDKLIMNFFSRHGGTCGAGSSLLALDSEFNIYPCHRLATIKGKEKYKLGNIFKASEFENFKIYNSYVRLKRKPYMYSAKTVLKQNFTNPWFMWCPATNTQTGDSIYYQSAKYNIMTSEVERAIKDILKNYGNINKRRQ